MRVALVCGRHLPAQDGVADYTARLAEALSAAGVEPLLAGAAPSPHVVCDGWGPRGVLQAARALRRLRPDVVHVQSAPSAYGFRGWVGLLPLLLRGTPVVTTLHEYGWWAWPARVPRRVWARLERSGRVDRETLLLAPASAEVLCTNEAHAAVVRARTGRQPLVVPIGPNVPDAGADRAAARAALGVADGTTLLVTFGFVHPVKGVRYLLDAAAQLRDELDLRVVVAGGFTSLALPEDEARAFRAELEQHARDAGVADLVSFTGHVPSAQVSSLLHAADAVVLAATAGVTTRSGALVAALAHGAPVLATVADPPDPALVPGEHVLPIARVRDGDAVAAAVRALVADPALGPRLAGAGRRLAAPRSWPVLARRHAELYARLVP